MSGERLVATYRPRGPQVNMKRSGHICHTRLSPSRCAVDILPTSERQLVAPRNSSKPNTASEVTRRTAAGSAIDFVTIAQCTIRLRHVDAAHRDPFQDAKSSNTRLLY
jgi:hypothetical protein